MFRKPAILLVALCSLAACNNDPPRIVNISPTSGPLGGGTTINVDGVNFDAKTQLFVGGQACSNVSQVSSGSLSGQTPPGAQLGGVTVTVKNDDGQRDHVTNGFEYTSGTGSVTVTSISPTSGDSGTQVTINGSGFQTNATVNFGSTAATAVNVVNSGQITCTAPAGSGVVAVTVQNTDGSNGQLANAFTYPGTGGSGTTKTIKTFAGTGTAGNAGDGSAATGAQLSAPQQLAVGSDGSVYIADTGNNRIRKVVSGGTISTIAGAGGELNAPRGVAVDSQGNVYIADTGNQVVKKLVGTTLSTIAGQQGSAGSAGENVTATSAQLNTPIGLAVDSQGNVFIADSQNHKVRTVTAGGVITTFAGTGSAGQGADTAQVSTSCALNNPSGVAIDSAGSVYIADTGNARVRKVSSGSIITFAGGGAQNPGDNGLATNATLQQPFAVAVDSSGGVLIADLQANVVRVVNSGTITLFAGNYQSGSTGDNGAATSATLASPRGVAAGSSVVYISDTTNNKVRSVQ